jgi:hypothetical protein
MGPAVLLDDFIESSFYFAFKLLKINMLLSFGDEA